MKLPAKYRELLPHERRRVRAEYVKRQNGRCMWCKEPLDGPPSPSVEAKSVNWLLFPPNFLKHPVHLQHDHFTGLTEGAVHAYCNAVMWQYHAR